MSRVAARKPHVNEGHCFFFIPEFFLIMAVFRHERAILGEFPAAFGKSLIAPLVNVEYAYHKFQGWLSLLRKPEFPYILKGVGEM
jgi:hypothetical protein